MEKRLTPMKAIREKCLDCCCGSAYEVKLCTAENCPLFTFRHGKNPNIKREYTEEQLAAFSERAKKMHQQKQELD